MRSPVFRAGYAETDITPPPGIEMAGYGPYERRVVMEVLDRLAAKALYLQLGPRRAVILSADVCMVDSATTRSVRAALRRAWGTNDFGLLVCATHTHSGPATQPTVAWGAVDPDYRALFERRLAEAAFAAARSARPARWAGGRVRIPAGVGVNREQPALAPLDTAAQVLRVDRADGRPLCAVFNYGAHAVTRYPFTSRASADWPGLAAAYVQAELGCPALFLQGACGNINGHEMSFARDDRELRQKVADLRCGDAAKRVGDAVIPALRGLATRPAARLEYASVTLPLPCRPIERAAMEALLRRNRRVALSREPSDLRPLHDRLGSETPDEIAWRRARYEFDAATRQLELLRAGVRTVPAPVTILRLDDAAIVGWPAEVFVELGLELRQRSPFPLTFVATFANDDVGYIPTPAVYESKGRANDFGRYPRDMTHLIYGRPPFRADVGRILVDRTAAALARLT